MRHVHRLLTAVVGVVVLATIGACGSSSDTAAGSSTTTVDDPATTTTEPEVTTTTTVPPDDEACLPGRWTMKQDSLDLLVASAVPFGGSSVSSGGWVLDLGEDGAASSEAKFTLAFAPAPDTNAEADVFWNHSGTWQADGDELVLEMSQTEAGTTDFRMNGFSAPGAFPIDGVAGIQGGPYTCEANALRVTTTNGTQPLEMLFER